MATVTITIPDTLVSRLEAAANALYPQYASLTPAAMFKQITADHWRAILVQYEAPLAATNQAQQSESDGAGIG